MKFTNPILSGFYPDPSICRVDEDYYLVTSTFEYFPGLPIFHSRDLVNWRQIGHVLDRPSQLNLDKIRPSGGLYAPTLRYHDGVFYVINTLVDGIEDSGNFIVTATDPAGPWSEPYWLEDAPGIDPSLFFDDDGRVWYCGNRTPEGGEKHHGDREIWLQELDLETMQLTGPTYAIWDGALKQAVHPEAPHIYKIDGMYYLLIAEGGTAHDHAITIARSESITGPYKGHLRNPILTHRHLGLNHPITSTGHGDLIQTQNGEWWMVALAIRPYGGYFYNLGRETFLVPVTWEDGGPIVNYGVGKIEFEHDFPNLPEHRWETSRDRDDFDDDSLAYHWHFLRTPRVEFWSLAENQNHLRLKLRPETIAERTNPSFIGRRQQHINFSAETKMHFSPQNSSECAGLVILQNQNFQYRCTYTLDENGNSVIQFIQRNDGNETLIAEKPVHGDTHYLKIEAYGQDYAFYFAEDPNNWQTLAENVDGRILSTPVAGGFVGAMMGPYASSNGQSSENSADFDWFDYRGLS